MLLAKLKVVVVVGEEGDGLTLTRVRVLIVRVTGMEIRSSFMPVIETVPVYTPAGRPATLTPTSSWSLGFAEDSVRLNQAALLDVTQFDFRVFVFRKLTAWLTGLDPPCTAVNVRLGEIASNACPFGTAMIVKNTSESRPIATIECLTMTPPATCWRENNATGVPDRREGLASFNNLLPKHSPMTF